MRYSVDASWSTGYGIDGTPCGDGDEGSGLLERANFSNEASWQRPDGGYTPLGFNGVNEIGADGSVSPSTTMTLQSLTMTVYYPQGMIDTSPREQAEWESTPWVNGFNFRSPWDQAQWTGPEHSTASLTDDATGATAVYDAFAFTWAGERTSTTVTRNTDGATGPWPDANTLSGSWAPNPDFCMPSDPQFAVRLEYAFTTENGASGRGDALHWASMIS